MKNIIFFTVVLLIISCNTHNLKEEKAYILERKRLSNGKLMIKYVFKAGNRKYTDSEEIRNIILPQDSVMIFFSPQHPEISELKEK